MIQRNYFILLIIVLLTSLFLNVYFDNKKVNIIDDFNINKGIGWANNTSLYDGSELNFSFSNSDFIEFEFSTESLAQQEIEIHIDNKIHFIDSLDFKDNKRINISNDAKHNISIRHHCTRLQHKCAITLEGIYLNEKSEILKSQPSKKIISILGDSISTLYGRNNYSNLLANRLGMELRNSSITGSTVTRIEGQESAIDRYKTDITGYDSDITIIFIGTNDAYMNVPYDKFYNDYSDIVKTIISQNKNNKIYLVSLLPRRDLEAEKIKSYSDIIKQLSISQNIHYIDTSGWIKANEFIDEIHPSSRIQNRFSNNFIKIIKSN